MCYLFIWQWVLRIISETLKFSRSMVLFECESMSKSVWAVINYGFECAYFMSVIQENEDLYLVAHTHHTLTHTRQKVVIVYFFCYSSQLCCILYLLGKRTIINFSSLSTCSWADEKNASQTSFQDKGPQSERWSWRVRQEKMHSKFLSKYLKRNKKGMFNNILTVDFQTFSRTIGLTAIRACSAGETLCAYMWKWMNANNRQQFSTQPKFNSIVIITFIKNTKHLLLHCSDCSVLSPNAE